MKFLFLSILLLFSFLTLAQDGVSPLISNPYLKGAKNYTQQFQKVGLDASFDSTFIYLSDTLELPFFDEFSRNNFQTYDKVYTGPNISEELYYSMLQEGTTIPMPAGTKLTDLKTYKVITDVDNDLSDTVFYDSTVFDYSALDVYPVIYIEHFGYPSYFIYDSIESGNTTTDTVFVLDGEYEQYEARIFFNELDDSTKLWLDSYAYHNYRMGKNPISLGVATFDGLDEYGYPYNFNSNTNALCDYLTSKPIAMDDFIAQDSVYFSFLYQTVGNGDPTEDIDSLFVEFYSPVDQLWERVWSAHGGQGETFLAGHIPLIDNKYFEDGFQFRFVNYGLPSGAIDQFNIDYVALRELSAYDDTLFRDFAFSYPLYTLLKDYTQVPWDHYRNNPSNKMSDALRVVLRNNETVPSNNSAGGSLSVFYNDVFEGNFNFVGAELSNPDLDYGPRTHYFSEIDISNGYEFDHTVQNDTIGEFTWIAEASIPATNYSFNDSTFGKQLFRDVYAYDDGTAELAYGPNGPQARLAYKFTAYEADSLLGIRMSFLPAALDVSNKLFLITVWSDNNGEPGEVIYQDDFFNPRQPKYTSKNNGFYTYYFTDTVKIPVDEVFYVGWRQIDQERLNIGLDVNINNQDKIFFSVDNESTWENSTFPGSILMRPVFSTKMDYQLSTFDNKKEVEFTVYPNPTNGLVKLKTDYKNSFELQLFDLRGREVLRKSNQLSLDLANFEPGIYLLRILDENQQVLKMAKIVKR